MTKPFYDEEMSRQQKQVAATADMRAQRDVVLNLLNLERGERVLEVGAGSGIFAGEMLGVVGEAGHVCGIDSSDPMVAMAADTCPKGEFLKGDATELPVDSGTFDACTASQLLCFVTDADRAISEMFRALKPGGRLVILDSDWGSLVWNCQDRDLMDRVTALMTEPYADANVPRSLSRRLVASGFKIVGRYTHTVLNWEPEADTYSQHLLSYVETMMQASDDFTASDWESWSADQQETAKAGEYMFSLNRYIFSAVKG